MALVQQAPTLFLSFEATQTLRDCHRVAPKDNGTLLRDAVTAAEVEEPRGDASWTMIAMWSSVLVMPVLAIVAKELFGGVNYGGAPSVDDFAFPPPSPE